MNKNSSSNMEDQTLSRLREIGPNFGAYPSSCSGPRIMFLSLYCYKSFPVREFHQLAKAAGMDSHAVFLKDNFTNHHTPISEIELGLVVDLVTRIKPDIIAMSVLAPYVPSARRVSAAIRKISKAPIIVGGKHATISPDEALSYADYACKGEGELVLLDVFARLKAGAEDFRGIAGLWYKDTNGKPQDQGQRHLIEELDLLPFEAYGEEQMYFIEHDKLRQDDPELESEEILIMAGRGCVYTCSYCVNSLLIPMNKGNGRFIRIRSPENVVAQIAQRMTKQVKARKVLFNDEVFGVFDEWTANFAEQYKQINGLPFACELVPKLIRPQAIEKLVKVGMYEMHFGIQSGSDYIRNQVLNRPGRNNELLEKAQLLVKNGVGLQCDLILGNPFDTAEVMEETIRLLSQMPQPMKLNTYKLQFFPHYPLTIRAVREGLVSPDDVSEEKVADMTMFNFVYVPEVKKFDRKTVLENCVYLIPWNNTLVWWLVGKLAAQHSTVLAILANILAAWRYQLDFRANPLLVFLRRSWLLGKMLLKGDLGQIRRKLVEKLGHA